jgi:hypothetical protein
MAASLSILFVTVWLLYGWSRPFVKRMNGNLKLAVNWQLTLLTK